MTTATSESIIDDGDEPQVDLNTQADEVIDIDEEVKDYLSSNQAILDGSYVAPANEVPADPFDTEHAHEEESTADAPAEPEHPPKERTNPNVTQDYVCVVHRIDKTNEPIYTLRINANEVVESIANFPLTKQGDEEVKSTDPWEEVAKAALRCSVTSGQYIEALERQKSAWRQNAVSNGKPLQIMRIGNNKSEPGKELTGDAAVAKFQYQYGLGSLVKIPLWHSGMWVTFKAPADTRLNIMLELIALEKITVGRGTNGLVFSGMCVWSQELLMDLAVECLYSVNLRDYNSEMFINLLSVHDLPIIQWALACAIYPNGYSISQPCLANPDKCKHVTEEHLNISKISWVDQTSLTENQLRHMESHSTARTREEVLKYQAEGLCSRTMSKVITVDSFGRQKDITFNLRIPTVANYLHTCNKWINEITNTIQNAFSDKVGDEKRDTFITRQATLTTLRQYAHFINDIVYADGSFVKNPDDIASVLNMLSGDNATVTTLLTSIRSFIDETVINLIALPSYNCPSCGGPMTATESKHPLLIPLEVSTFFFTLVGRKL